uniref:NP n=1 Tax=Wenling hagfish influenza virus TaxID=2116481 RepID=A0A2P1GNW9_9ORTO|nr:NP [Wenling hagfish influenza virus]
MASRIGKKSDGKGKRSVKPKPANPIDQLIQHGSGKEESDEESETDEETEDGRQREPINKGPAPAGFPFLPLNGGLPAAAAGPSGTSTLFGFASGASAMETTPQSASRPVRQQNARGSSEIEEKFYARFAATLMGNFTTLCFPKATAEQRNIFCTILENGMALCSLVTATVLFKPSKKAREEGKQRLELTTKVIIPNDTSSGTVTSVVVKVSEVSQMILASINTSGCPMSAKTVERFASMLNYSETTAAEVLYTRTGGALTLYGTTAVLSLGRASGLSRKAIPYMRDGIGVLADLNTLHSLNSAMLRKPNPTALPAWNACSISLSRKASTESLKELAQAIRNAPGTSAAANFINIYANACLMIPPQVKPYIFPNPAICFADLMLNPVEHRDEEFSALGYQTFRVLKSAGRCGFVLNGGSAAHKRTAWQVALLGAGFEDQRVTATVWGQQSSSQYKRKDLDISGLRLTNAMLGKSLGLAPMEKGVAAWASSVINPGTSVVGSSQLTQWSVNPMFFVERTILTDKELAMQSLDGAIASEARNSAEVIKHIREECDAAKTENVFTGGKFYQIDDKDGKHPMGALKRSVSYFYTNSA